jgi:hypothetical protein
VLLSWEHDFAQLELFNLFGAIGADMSFLTAMVAFACNFTHLSNGSFFMAAIPFACLISSLLVETAMNEDFVGEAMTPAHNFPPTKSKVISLEIIQGIIELSWKRIALHEGVIETARI